MSIVIEYLVLLVYVTIADYDYNEVLWKVLIYDACGWLHECAYITALFIGFVWLTFRAEEWQLRITRKRRLKT